MPVIQTPCLSVLLSATCHHEILVQQRVPHDQLAKQFKKAGREPSHDILKSQHRVNPPTSDLLFVWQVCVDDDD